MPPIIVKYPIRIEKVRMGNLSVERRENICKC